MSLGIACGIVALVALLSQAPGGGTQAAAVAEPDIDTPETLRIPLKVATVDARPHEAAPEPAPDPVAAGTEPAGETPQPVTAGTPTASESPAPALPGETLELEVRSGDSLDRLFRRHGISVADLALILRVQEAAPHLKKIRPGDVIQVRHDKGTVLSLTRRINETRSLVVETTAEEGYAARFLEHPVEIRRRHAQGRIDSSFYVAGLEAGMSDKAIMELAGVFAWDIDFALDIRRNDWFAVVYEEIWQDGEKLRDGEVLAAEFGNQGRVFRAVRFVDPDGDAGYFTPEGRSVRKAFLRAPVDFTRVSSSFNPNRLHPILKVKRPHRGVDYAARKGTPIKAAGDGRVIHAGTKGGYGTTVILQHGGNVTTLYAHMSRIAPAARPGRRVKQGQVIGYVGKTGLATAPHLHYEYRLNGVHRNPRTVPLPEADPVPEALRQKFALATSPLLAELDALSPTRLASAE
ncbi:MAG: peptidoglycan DD-metalloendopeptidase family protein [Gammaproteobacteria bacterium]